MARGSLSLTGGNINFVEHKDYWSVNVLGEEVYLYLNEEEIFRYSMLVTNVEMFGRPWWDKYKKNMGHHTSKVDGHLFNTIEKNIDWWTRDKIIEKVLE